MIQLPAFTFCFQFQLAPLPHGRPPRRLKRILHGHVVLVKEEGYNSNLSAVKQRSLSLGGGGSDGRNVWSGVGAAAVVVRWGAQLGGSGSHFKSNGRPDSSRPTFPQGNPMAAGAQRRRRAGAGCGGAALIPPSAGNGGTGDPLARWSVGSMCTLTSIHNSHIYW